MCHWPRIPFRHVMGLAVLLLAATAPAMVLRVPGDAPDLATALGFAQSGDTLLLRPGRHRAVDLHLADGITVLGEGPGVVLKGNHHRPLLNIRGAYQGVVLENLELTGGRNRRDGGALRITDSRVRLTGLTIRGCRARHAGGALFALDSHLELRDCLFLDNRADNGGAIAVAARDTNAVTGQLVVDNALFAGNRARTGGALSTEVHVYVTHGTFAGNVVEGTDAEGSAIRAGSSLELVMCNLVDNRGGSPGAGPVALSKDDTLCVSYTNIHGNSGGDEPVASRTGKGNLSVDPRFVDVGHDDFHLRWDSPLLDIGDPDAPLDFDLTKADIGWQPKYPVVEIHGGVSDLPAGHYQLTTSTVVDGEIEAGAVIRCASNNTLLIRGTGGTGMVRSIGSVDGPRTAIVGRPHEDAEPASVIRFYNNDDDPDTPLNSLELNGVLFNYAPKNGDDTSIFFEYWESELGSGIELDGTQVQFQNFSGKAYTGGVRFDGGLRFKECTGSVRGIAFGDTVNTLAPAFLSMASSRMDVLDCTFLPGKSGNTSDTPSLKIHGTHTGPEPRVHDNVFTGLPNRNVPMLDLGWANTDLERNQFQDAYRTPLMMQNSTLHADYEARNSFAGHAQFEPDEPLIDMQGGFLHMFCGRNNFIVPFSEPGWPFVSWMADSIGLPPVVGHWRENYWGTSCQDFIPEVDLNDPTQGYLPNWSDAEDCLTECLDPTDPPNPICPLETSTPYVLLANGKLYEQLGDYANAHLQYQAVLLLYSSAKTSNEATLRLKALGLHKTYGPENYEAVRDHLFQAGDSSKVEGLYRQAMLQVCSGWCVEARWGNRFEAVATLNALFAVETDKINKDTIKLALLEIATYPVQGQMSAAGPEGQMTLAIAQQEAVNTLLTYKRGQWADEEDTSVLPQTFQISNLYPNPFNARTTIVLQVPAEEKVRVEVYNLLGQLVGTLHNGVLPAGEHRLVANAERWASGLYFVTAESAGKVQVRKMLLVK